MLKASTTVEFINVEFIDVKNVQKIFKNVKKT